MMLMRSYKDMEIAYDYQSGDLLIQYSKLRSLEGCPEHITGGFYCNENNSISSLVGGPQRVAGDYSCRWTKLTNLVGCANHIGGALYCDHNHITSLVGIHKIIKSCSRMIFDSEKITEGGIGLLLIENLTNISCNTEPFQIIKKYLGSGTKGMMDCRSKLISKGYSDHAKL